MWGPQWEGIIVGGHGCPGVPHRRAALWGALAALECHISDFVSWASTEDIVPAPERAHLGHFFRVLGDVDRAPQTLSSARSPGGWEGKRQSAVAMVSPG